MASVTIKGLILLLTPVEVWGPVTLSAAAFVPVSWALWHAVAGVIDLPILIMFGIALVGIRATKGKSEPLVPLWVLALFAVFQTLTVVMS